jgi:hypothetical protein
VPGVPHHGRGARAAEDAAAVPQPAAQHTASNERDRRDRGTEVNQTAIVIDVGGGHEMLVRITGVHVASDLIQVDERWFGRSWTPVAFEVRNEGEG